MQALIGNILDRSIRENRAEQHPIPIHPLGAPWPPRSIQGKMMIAISESRRPRRNSVRYPVNAG
jgi:hypothetical protein